MVSAAATNWNRKFADIYSIDSDFDSIDSDCDVDEVSSDLLPISPYMFR